MFKVVILLTRRVDMSHDEFVTWWLDEHAQRAAQLPRVRRALFNVVDAGAAEGGPDGISELWFDSQADFEAAYATEIGVAVAADSMAHLGSRVRLFVTEHDIGATS